MSLGASGWWTIPDFPDAVTAVGRTFRKARIRQQYPHVVEQYREEVAQNSMHLFVYDDQSWAIAHVDKYNPDKGFAFEHFFADHPLGQAIVGVAAVAGIVVLVGAVAAGAAAILRS